MLKIERERNGKQRIGEPKEKREKSVPEENRERKRRARVAQESGELERRHGQQQWWSTGGIGNFYENEKVSSNII